MISPRPSRSWGAEATLLLIVSLAGAGRAQVLTAAPTAAPGTMPTLGPTAAPVAAVSFPPQWVDSLVPQDAGMVYIGEGYCR